jgi:cysteinyl-tRNA synthetase
MTLRVYNTLTRRKEAFVPIREGEVRMYACGITAYDGTHIGHARSALVFDVISRYLKHKGYTVTYVKNYTDVDDKIIKRAHLKKVPWDEIAERYIAECERDMEELGMEPPTFSPKATEHIGDMISVIKRLEEKGYAYRAGGDVFFSVSKFKDYGKLSGKNLEELQAGSRVEVDGNKADPLDFVLWKASKPGEPKWDSPWGEGRPGWHIECSAMSQRFLGDTFDIHGGGMDLIFPHHENEIAQSEGATGRPFARYWIHNGFVNIRQEKMSKSAGNISLNRDLLENHHPEAVRLFLLSTHYKSPVNFSEEGLKEAKVGLDRLYGLLKSLDEVEGELKGGGDAPAGEEASIDEKVSRAVRELIQKFEEAMDDDFNTASALGHIYVTARALNGWLSEAKASGLLRLPRDFLKNAREAITGVAHVLGILTEEPARYFGAQQGDKLKEIGMTEDEIAALIGERAGARKEKNFKRADEIRAHLKEKGVLLEDGPQGTTWKVQ